MEKARSLKKFAAVLGLLAVLFMTGFAAANIGQRNAAEEYVEATPPAAAVTTTTATTTEKTAVKLAAPAAVTFSYDCINETVTVEGKSLPVREVEKTLIESEGVAKFTAKAVVGEKTVLLNGEVPTTVLEPLIAEFKTINGTQITKFDNGFVTATIA